MSDLDYRETLTGDVANLHNYGGWQGHEAFV